MSHCAPIPLLLAAVSLLIGCERVELPREGQYRGVVEVPGGDLPFGLEVAREDGTVVLYLENAAERMRVPEVVIEEQRLEAKFPGYQNSLTAVVSRDRLDGELTLVKAKGVEQVMPFTATFGDDYRFFDESASDNADVSGRWQVTFTEDSGRSYPAVAEFEQAHDRVTGTFLTPTSDHRFLEGQVRGETLHLSTFDGAHAYLYRAKIDAEGALVGEFWSGTKWHETWRATRDEAASIADFERATRLVAPQNGLDFTFPDLDGTPVSLSDPRFDGKVVIVTIAGSWCPNCHDEAAFLAPLYDRYRDDGLEVVALMFEYFDDFSRAVEATRRFRERHGIEYPTLIAGISDKDEASKALPSLNRVLAYPTTIFIDRRGEVREIHTGFSGPATGEHYERLTGDFEALVERLLAEPAS
jgi:peroxiredoxin